MALGYVYEKFVSQLLLLLLLAGSGTAAACCLLQVLQANGLQLRQLHKFRLRNDYYDDCFE